MKRDFYNILQNWKQQKNRKPMVLQGARQVGKTFIVNEFGTKEYTHYNYLNFEQDSALKELFKDNLHPSTIITNLSLYFNKKIEAADSLLFFDEIQVCPEALTSLKYFQEQAPEYHIIAAGSLLGVSVGKQSSFPVGKINFHTLYPLSFKEFLQAIDENQIIEYLENKQSFEALPELIHNKLNQHLKLFLFLGGMPEVVQDYINNNDIVNVRKIQDDILEAYANDFSKYASNAQAIKTTELWQSIPYQLAKENKKFKYSAIKKNARSAHYQQTITWLEKAGLIHIAHAITVPKLPLAGYIDASKFKLYMLDTGLLGALLQLSSDSIIKPNQLYAEYNGAFIENYVALELVKQNEKKLFYWTSRSDAEVDFIIQHKQLIIPLEVKSGMSRNLKSIRSYASKYKPKLLCRTSPRNFYADNDFRNIPLYAQFIVKKLLQL